MFYNKKNWNFRLVILILDLGGKADVDGYIASEPDNSTFTHIYSTSLLGGSTMILAEKNCIRRINFNQAEDETNRIGKYPT